MKNTIKKALITGANGFVGSHLCKYLDSIGIPVHALILAGSSKENILLPHVEIFEGNVCQKESLIEPLKGVSHVFHLAAITSDWASDEAFDQVNVVGTKNLFHASMNQKVERFLFVSSISVHQYTGISNGTEDLPLNGNINGYAKSKIECEVFLKNQSQYKNYVTIIRPGLMPFGPGDRLSMGGLIKALKKNQFAYINKGESKMCFSYIENLVVGMVLANTHPNSTGEVFILSDDDTLTWKEFTEVLAHKIGVKPPELSLPYTILVPFTWVLETIYSIFKISTPPPLTFYRISVPRKDLVFLNHKAKKILGYNPRIRFTEAIETTIQCFKKEGLV